MCEVSHESESATFFIFGFWQLSAAETPAAILTLSAWNDVVSLNDVTKDDDYFMTLWHFVISSYVIFAVLVVRVCQRRP